MQLGLVGLGKMGGNMRERIRRAGHEVVGYDRNQDRLGRPLARRHGQEARRPAGRLGHGSARRPDP